jgi:hypothetical protein
MKTYFLLYQPTNLDLRLALQDGKVLGHLPNYTRVFTDKPVNTDGAIQLLAFKAPDSVVHTVRDDGIDKVYVWAGDRGTRSNPQDLVRVEIAHMGAEAGVTSATQTAKDVFASMPDEVKLAAVLSAVPRELVEAVFGPTSGQGITWAEGVLQSYTKQG